MNTPQIGANASRPAADPRALADERERQLIAEGMPRCGCGRFVNTAAQHGWFKYGEHGTEEGFVCLKCLPKWSPQDGLGRGTEAGYCGVFNGEFNP